MESLELEKLGLYQSAYKVRENSEFSFWVQCKMKNRKWKPWKTDSTRFLSFPRTQSCRPRHFAVMDVSS